jgi:hypothetical protein
MAYYQRFAEISFPAAAVPPGPRIADQGGRILLTNPTVVYYWSSVNPRGQRFRLLAPGEYVCNDDTFGGRPYGVSAGSTACYQGPIAAGGVIGTATGVPGAAPKIADDGQPFQRDSGASIWYGPASGSGAFVGHNVPTGTYICGSAQFGPDPAINVKKACYAAPYAPPAEGSTPITYYDQLAAQQEAEQRAVAAKQAQQDLYQAQLATQQQNADAAAQSAQLAENALAQQAAALKAAEAYRQIQQQASDQAAAIAVELAKIAAMNAEDADAAAAAVNMAAEAEAIHQATVLAKADAATQNQAYLAAQGAALSELRNQEQALARLKAAQDAAATQAELEQRQAMGGGAPVEMDTMTMLLYGGLALGALLLFKK